MTWFVISILLVLLAAFIFWPFKCPKCGSRNTAICGEEPWNSKLYCLKCEHFSNPLDRHKD